MDIATAVRDRRGWLDALPLPELKSPAPHKTLVKDAISAVFDAQAPDGFIPHRMNPVDGHALCRLGLPRIPVGFL
jgi:hypothetical protein